MKKICFVVQRYGKEIVGGAESLCMQYVGELKHSYDIDVVTSCAIDYDTWDNYFADGIEYIGGVSVYRYVSKHPRRNDKIGKLTQAVYDNPQNSNALGKKWLKEVGPYCPGMLKHIKRRQGEYALFIFVGYHYYNSTFGLPCVSEKAVFLPTAHDEPPLRKCNYFRYLFSLPRAFIFLSEEERDFINSYFSSTKNKPSIVAGLWVNPAKGGSSELIPNGKYIAYMGRIDETKNCDKLFEYFAEYKKRGGSLKLLLMGKALIELPQSDDIVYTGFVDEAEKFFLLREAEAFVMPSENESLSISTLEAMACGTPVLVNSNSKVLSSHVEKSGAGLAYADVDTFCAGIENIASRMGEKGIEYIKQNYDKSEIIGKIKNLLESLI